VTAGLRARSVARAAIFRDVGVARGCVTPGRWSNVKNKITIQHIRSKTVFGFACVACLGSRRDRANDSPLFFLGHDIFVVVDIDVLSLFINVPHF